MNEITCPNCHKTFTIDGAGFADILKQVRNTEFDKELHERMEILEKDKESAVLLAEQKTKNELMADSSLKDAEIAKLKSQLGSTDTEKKLAVMEAVNVIAKEKDKLSSELQLKETEKHILERQNLIRSELLLFQTLTLKKIMIQKPEVRATIYTENLIIMTMKLSQLCLR